MTPIVLAILVLGFSGIVAQVLLLRELLITFNSNELTIGIILANWLILESAGSFLMGRVIEGVKRRLETFVGVTILFSLFFPAAVYLSRTCRDLLGVLPGEAIGLHQAFYASLLILLPVSLSHGALFTAACKLFSEAIGRRAVGIGKVYLYETMGTIAGGAVFTWLLVTKLTSFQVTLGVSLANALVCLGLLARPGIGSAGEKVTQRIGRGRRTLAGASAVVSVVLAWTLAGPAAGNLHHKSVRRQWRFQEVVYYENSIYGNVAVTQRAGEYTFFADGLPVITTPTPDVAAAEDFAHLPLLFHPAPGRVAVLSGGAGGLLREVLKYPVKQVDYAELDPLLLEVLRRFPTPLTEEELDDPRVRVHYRDGRLFLAQSEPATYDLILLGLTEPQDLQTNRLFSREFFSLALRKLKPGGILAFRLPGSLTYLGPEIRDLNAVVLSTLDEIFPAVRVLPGDGLNLFLASPAGDLLTVGPEILIDRLTQRSLSLSFISPGYLRYRLDPAKSDWLSGSLAGAEGGVNRDFKPLGVYYSLSYWNARFSPTFQKIFGGLKDLHLTGAVLLAGLIFFLPAAVFQWRRKTRRPAVVLAIASTGMAGMVFDLVLIFAFQALYGYVFFWVGILVTAFMAGTALGGLLMVTVMDRLRKDTGVLLSIEGGLALFSVLLPAVFLTIGAGAGQAPRPIQGVFIFLAAAGGTLIGLEFPLANKIYLGPSGRVGKTVGLLYGADLLGGWIGGIAGGVILVPVVGLVKTCLVVAFYKVLSLIVLALPNKKGTP